MSHKIKITLNHTDPKVYRTILVPENFNFEQLHLVIQCVMNWENYHMYQFNLGAPYASGTIKMPDSDEFQFDDYSSNQFETHDASKTYLTDFAFASKNRKIIYIYDFGDDWIHNISFLKKPSEEVLYPKCIDGQNAAPPEDCGGIYGFYDLIETSNKKKLNAEEKEMLEFYGLGKGKKYEEEFAFKKDTINKTLLNVFKS